LFFFVVRRKAFHSSFVYVHRASVIVAFLK